ncbi:Transcription initiation factor IIB [Porphyridium purpureum]|uniref:General transcription factor TFIIB n=1 Tax=Porphyridium purpureum TaxID=35688 RepID=A0A5J4YSQ3_PORPP|nr:Transcription initiation factor IIB [Porphyridium purpureum]|eukprot:POR1847..scf229_5
MSGLFPPRGKKMDASPSKLRPPAGANVAGAPIMIHAPGLERDLPEQCTECGSDDIVEDWKQGTLVCRGCGLVLQAEIVDLGSEWRTFTSDEPGQDPNRVGGPANPLLESGPTTKIRDELRAAGLNRAQKRNAISSSDRYLMDVFSKIGQIAEHFSISKVVVDRTEEIFKRYYDVLTLKPDGTRSRSLPEDETNEIIAAALLIAFRDDGIARSFKEIVTLTKVPKQNIGARVKLIERDIGKSVRHAEPSSASDFIPRYCNRLSLPPSVSNAALHVYEKVRERDGVYGKQPNSIIAACLYLVCQISRDPEHRKKTPKEIGGVAGVAEATVRQTYRTVQEYTKEIVPSDFPSILVKVET